MGHFKTTMLCVGVPLWIVGRDNNATFLIACSSQNLAMDRVVRLKDNIAGNEYFKDMFGELRPSGIQNPWSKERATVQRDLQSAAPTFQAFGTSTDVQGTRFDYGIVDDAVNENNITTAKMRMETYNYISSSVWSRLEAGRRVEIVLGTIYHYGDAYSMIKEKAETDKTWLYTEKQAILNPEEWPPDLPEDCEYHSPEVVDRLDFSKIQVLWPEYWTPERLYLDYCGGTSEFARTRMNQPLDPESQIFNAEIMSDMCRADGNLRSDGEARPSIPGWNTSIGKPKPGTLLWQRYKANDLDIPTARLIMSVDPAGGSVVGRPSRKLDYTVFELWGMFENNYRILMDMWWVHGHPLQRVKQQYGLWLAMYKPDDVLMEADAHQRVTAASWEAEFGYPVKPVLMPKQKYQHIEALADLVHSGLLLYPWATAADRKKFGKFENELIDYPFGKNDDTLMAALHAHMFIRPSSAVRHAARFKEIAPERIGTHRGKITRKKPDEGPKKGLYTRIEEAEELTQRLSEALGISG